MAALASIDDVKAYVNITTDADDVLLTSLVEAESAYILSWLGRSFETAYCADLFGGTGGTEHLFRSWLVTAVTSVTVDGVSIPSSAALPEPGYMVYDDRLLLFGYRFAWGQMNCRVLYTAGEATPAAVRQACVELVGYRYRNRDRIGLASKSIAGETTAYITKEMPDHVQGLLQPYRRVTP